MKRLVLTCIFILATTNSFAKAEMFEFKNFNFDKKSSNITSDSLLMFSNSTLALTYESSQATAYKIVIKAKGTTAKGGWPTIEVKVNNVSAGKQEIKSTSFVDMTIYANMVKGANKVVLIYDNDVLDEKTKEDRNLSIQSVTFDLK